jgi:RNA polymerase sigma-54 factor
MMTNQTAYSGNSSTKLPPLRQQYTTESPAAENESRNEASDWAEPSFSSSAPSPDDEDDGYSEVAADRPSMREHLLWELNMSQLDDRDKKIIGLLIDALDENAYLSQPLEEIIELLPVELDITLDDLETALVQLQHLDAPGIGARSLSECLALQLEGNARRCSGA